MAEGPQALKKDPPFGVAAPEGGSFLLVRTMNILLSLHFYYTLSRLKVKQGAESLQTQSRSALPLGELARERLRGQGQHDRAAAQR